MPWNHGVRNYARFFTCAETYLEILKGFGADVLRLRHDDSLFAAGAPEARGAPRVIWEFPKIGGPFKGYHKRAPLRDL